MKSEYAAQYRDLYENHWWWRARESYILGILRRERAQKKHGAVLDIGCGDGLFFDHLAEFGEVEGVEADAAIVSDDGPHRDRIHVCQFDETFQPGKKYSLIVMLDLLEHLPDPLGGLKHALELLEEDGTIVITVPAFRALWTTHDDWNHHFTRYTKRTFLSSARDAEMQIESLRSTRARRDGNAAGAALAKARAAAEAGDNVMPAIMEAVKAYATVGEITDAMVEIYGHYEEPIRF